MRKARDHKPHIGIFGRRNTGKSSIINALAGQDVAIVSGHAGTTTDPVKKSMEIFGIGPVVLIDTAGTDDTGDLGSKRIRRTMSIINQVDCAVLVIDGNDYGRYERDLVEVFGKNDLPFILVHNKSDIRLPSVERMDLLKEETGIPVIPFSAKTGEHLDEVQSALKKAIPDSVFMKPPLVGDLVEKGDYVLLVTPIDNEAPEGRMILPQVMAIRDVLDHDCINLVLKENMVEPFFRSAPVRPALVITDSQVFGKIKDLVPEDIPFTSFSIMLARYRGDFRGYLKGTPAIDRLAEGDRILLLESCTHQINCDDIGRYKIPDWLTKHTGKRLSFDVVAGLDDVGHPLTDYALVIQCGGCMVTRRQLNNRLKPALDAGVPVTNYGMAIAWMNGIFERVTRPFLTQYATAGQ